MTELKVATLTGSEKQIAWATDIIEYPYKRMLADAKDFRDIWHEIDKADICEKAAAMYMEAYYSATSNPNMASAAWVIDHKAQFASVMDRALKAAIIGTTHKRYEFRESYGI